MVKKIIFLILIINLLLLSGCNLFTTCDIKENRLCYQELAVEKNNPDFCEKYELEKSRNACFLIAAYKLNDDSICDRIVWVNYEINKESCIIVTKNMNNDS